MEKAVTGEEHRRGQARRSKPRWRRSNANLVQWIAATTASTNILNDFSIPASIALLETAIDRYLDLHGEEDAHDLIERAFRRVVNERRGPLQ